VGRESSQPKRREGGGLVTRIRLLNVGEGITSRMKALRPKKNLLSTKKAEHQKKKERKGTFYRAALSCFTYWTGKDRSYFAGGGLGAWGRERVFYRGALERCRGRGEEEPPPGRSCRKGPVVVDRTQGGTARAGKRVGYHVCLKRGSHHG